VQADVFRGWRGAPGLPEGLRRSTCTALGARIRTLAYVVNECCSDARGTALCQALRIRRGDCPP